MVIAFKMKFVFFELSNLHFKIYRTGPFKTVPIQLTGTGPARPGQFKWVSSKLGQFELVISSFSVCIALYSFLIFAFSEILHR